MDTLKLNILKLEKKLATARGKDKADLVKAIQNLKNIQARQESKIITCHRRSYVPQ